MKTSISKTRLKQRRRVRVQAKLSPSPDRPRLIVTITNRHVIAQIIDIEGKSLAFVSSHHQKLAPTLSARAQWVGTAVAKQAQAKKIKRVVLDRNWRRYHGRLKALAEAARTAGLEF